MYETFRKNKESFFLLLISLISAVLMLFCIEDGNDWGGDFALYIEQAHALLNGSIDELYAMNKYSTDRAFRVQGPYLYPMGFPILLMIPYCFLGINLLAMKIFCALFFLLSLPMLYRLFRPHFTHSAYTFCLLIIIAFHRDFITFSDTLFSDFPFFFFSTLVFLQMRKAKSPADQLLLGVGIFFTYLVRDIGIVLVPTLMVYQFQVLFIEKREVKNRWVYLLPYLVFIFFYGGHAVFLPKGNENHYHLLFSKLTVAQIGINVEYYKDLLATFFFLKPLFLIPLLLPLLAGLFFPWKQHLHFITYVALTLLVLLIWPAYQGMRFVFPILPFLLYFLLKGFQELSDRLKIPGSYQVALLALCLIVMTYQSIEAIVKYDREDWNECYNAEAKLMYRYISENIPKDEIIGFAKPRILRLFTGRNSILSDLDHFPVYGISYLLVRKMDNPVIDSRYKKIYETENLILIHQ